MLRAVGLELGMADARHILVHRHAGGTLAEQGCAAEAPCSHRRGAHRFIDHCVVRGEIMRKLHRFGVSAIVLLAFGVELSRGQALSTDPAPAIVPAPRVFRPITDQVLENPDPADWPGWR